MVKESRSGLTLLELRFLEKHKRPLARASSLRRIYVASRCMYASPSMEVSFDEKVPMVVFEGNL